jgi:hypothetical protein
MSAPPGGAVTPTEQHFATFVTHVVTLMTKFGAKQVSAEDVCWEMDMTQLPKLYLEHYPPPYPLMNFTSEQTIQWFATCAFYAFQFSSTGALRISKSHLQLIQQTNGLLSFDHLFTIAATVVAASPVTVAAPVTPTPSIPSVSRDDRSTDKYVSVSSSSINGVAAPEKHKWIKQVIEMVTTFGTTGEDTNDIEHSMDISVIKMLWKKQFSTRCPFWRETIEKYKCENFGGFLTALHPSIFQMTHPTKGATWVVVKASSIKAFEQGTICESNSTIVPKEVHNRRCPGEILCLSYMHWNECGFPGSCYFDHPPRTKANLSRSRGLCRFFNAVNASCPEGVHCRRIRKMAVADDKGRIMFIEPTRQQQCEHDGVEYEESMEGKPAVKMVAKMVEWKTVPKTMDGKRIQFTDIMCYEHLHKTCSRGDECHYKHAAKSSRNVNITKGICTFYSTLTPTRVSGACRYGDECTYVQMIPVVDECGDVQLKKPDANLKRQHDGK